MRDNRWRRLTDAEHGMMVGEIDDRLLISMECLPARSIGE
jgi:hypothetical protein